jgi:hypothetical protein
MPTAGDRHVGLQYLGLDEWKIVLYTWDDTPVEFRSLGITTEGSWKPDEESETIHSKKQAIIEGRMYAQSLGLEFREEEKLR